MKLLLNLSVGAGIEMGPNRINEKKSLVKVIFEFDFLVAYFQFQIKYKRGTGGGGGDGGRASKLIPFENQGT